jgi:Mn-dependent DtxR family transcriptional regulator
LSAHAAGRELVLADMLGVRQAAVAEVVAQLQNSGALRYERNRIQVLTGMALSFARGVLPCCPA